MLSISSDNQIYSFLITLFLLFIGVTGYQLIIYTIKSVIRNEYIWLSEDIDNIKWDLFFNVIFLRYYVYPKFTE
jgi:hypothetical protein